MKSLRLVSITILGFYLIPIGASSADISDSFEIGDFIISPEKAIGQATQYIGLENKLGPRAKLTQPEVHNFKILDTITPFLRNDINDKSCWLVEFSTVTLQNIRSLPGKESSFDLKVYLDSTTGTLFKISMKTSDSISEEFPKPMASSAESQLSASGERFIGFPKSFPEVGFFDALQASIGNFLLAKEIDATYIDHAYLDRSSGPVWVISLYGIPPLPRMSDESPVDQQNNRMRSVIDARTGKLLYAHNGPHVTSK